MDAEDLAAQIAMNEGTYIEFFAGDQIRIVIPSLACIQSGVYWQEDNETGRISNVEAGIGGTKISGATKYTMTYVRDDIIHANESEISIEIKANFSAETFPIVNGKLDISRGPTISIKSKIFVEGKVWPQQMYGEFTIRFVGDGIWEIEREL